MFVHCDDYLKWHLHVSSECCNFVKNAFEGGKWDSKSLDMLERLVSHQLRFDVYEIFLESAEYRVFVKELKKIGDFIKMDNNNTNETRRNTVVAPKPRTIQEIVPHHPSDLRVIRRNRMIRHEIIRLDVLEHSPICKQLIDLGKSPKPYFLAFYTFKPRILSFQTGDKILYCIAIKREEEEYAIYKRFSEFDNLHLQLELKLKEDLPKLPSKQWWKFLTPKNDPEFLEQRRIELEKYIIALSKCESCIVLDEIQDFIHRPDN